MSADVMSCRLIEAAVGFGNTRPAENATTPETATEPGTATPELSEPEPPESSTDTTYRLVIECEGGGDEAADFTERPSPEKIRARLAAWTDHWAGVGDWGDHRYGRRVVIDYKWSLCAVPGDDDEPVEIDSDVGEFEVEPDHDSLLLATCPNESARDRLCGTGPDDHDWVGEGGCDTNPGLWATGGTSWKQVCRCRLCGLRRRTTHCGDQRNPWDHDRVEYEMPGRWCVDCESEECDCQAAE